MPSASQPAPALCDRTERHVFALLGDLPANERRVLALLELAGADRAAAAADTGLDDTALRFAAKRARKALRRGSAPLSAGARCERAELLLSDRIDGPLRRPDRKWLEIHLARCPRCEEHHDLLDAARDDLRATFLAAPPPMLPPAPKPPALEERAQLRVVPSPPEPEPLGDLDRPTADEPRPTVAPEEEELVTERAPAPEPSPLSMPVPPPALGEVDRPTADERHPSPSPAMKRAAKVLAILLVLAGLVAGAIAAGGALGGDGTPPRAPWDATDAPEVRPAPLTDQ